MCEEGANDDDNNDDSKERCNWIGPLNSLHKHYINCQYKIIICNNCNHMETRSSMLPHKRQCQHRLITCKFCNKIGQYKKDNNITILQTNRWNAILERAYERGDKLGLSQEFITKYFDNSVCSST